MAQIDLAAASAAAVTEGGAILQRARGIARIRKMDANHLALTVKSGRYSFEIT